MDEKGGGTEVQLDGSKDKKHCNCRALKDAPTTSKPGCFCEKGDRKVVCEA